MKKYIIMLSLTCVVCLNAIACDLCKKQQPRFLQDAVHGRGPDSNWDYLIVSLMVIVTLYILFATLKCLIRPRENDEAHIKRMILKD